MPDVLNLAAFIKDTRAVGPGVRDAVWVQGCTIGCAGCGNQAFLPHVPRRRMPVAQVVRHLRRRRAVIRGLSVLGGEPTEQAAPVAALLEGAHALGLDTVVFTGRLYEDLQGDPDPAIHRLLAATDLLIDGPYVAAERDPSLRWRGSRNQRLLCLGEAMQGLRPGAADPAAEVIVSVGGAVVNGVARLRMGPRGAGAGPVIES
ncbi:MAG: 4Fe-4S single cluster domain-containing protein [Rhodothermales bacterium]|nr:4Fe-4S single cluster domain-containing protein [Rhodothermales bacterium]